MITVLVEAGVLAPESEIRLDEAERHHLKVRRAREGEAVRLLDGHGGAGEGTLVGSTSEGIIHVTIVRHAAAPVRRGLAVAAGDRDRFGWLVEKSAELGVTDLVPIETERTAAVGTRVRGLHVERFQRRALEAIKQSGAVWVPVVHPPVGVAELADRYGEAVRWLADAGGERAEAIRGDQVAWAAIGPEGGFTDAERDLLRASGWMLVRLGRNILRFETAALAAAVLMTSHDS